MCSRENANLSSERTDLVHASAVNTFLPDPKSGDVTLYPKDIADQFELPFNVFFTQGGTIYDNKIYYTYGSGKDVHPDALRVIDLDKKEYVLCEDLTDTPFGQNEVECCAFYNGRMLINTQACQLYERL